jgi:putative aminopeptidase FrvX
MDSSLLLETARAVLAQPTAPFHEDQVRAEIHLQLAQMPHVRVQQDRFGNIIALFQRGDAAPQFAFAAHMDHPGYVNGEFLGWVPEAYRAKNPATRDFGPFAMWDLPAFEVRGKKIYSRACDDLIGCATILAMFKELEHAGVEASCYGLFTRAEEVGFVGAIHMAKEQSIPLDTTIISLETSSQLGGPVKMGDGVIIRLGDRTGIFDSITSAQLLTLAKEREIPYQRALMQGGTCEATAYQLYGYRTAGLCMALGNYHNCGPKETIASEYVSIDDVMAMVQLCTVAASSGLLPNPQAALREKYERSYEKYRALF